jgi:hypothetical protein
MPMIFNSGALAREYDGKKHFKPRFCRDGVRDARGHDDGFPASSRYFSGPIVMSAVPSRTVTIASPPICAN